MRPGICTLIASRRAGVEPTRTGCYASLAKGITGPRGDGGSHAASRTGDVACERPADERVGVSVPHAMLGLQVSHEGHMLLETAAHDDLLPLRDRAPVLLLDRWE